MIQIGDENQGVFPLQYLEAAVHDGLIGSSKYNIPRTSFQPASLDLRLGEKAYRLRCSFLPDKQSVQEKLRDFAMEEIDLRDGAILERNRPYLIPLVEELSLPAGVRGKANPRSSTGRLDIFTRVISDHGHKFDEIRPGYNGKLYLEVLSRTFTIKVRTLESLNQLRLMTGKAKCDDDVILGYHRETPILYEGGFPVPADELVLSNGLLLGVDLKGDQHRVVGYRAKKNSLLLDLSLLGHYEPTHFWEPVYPEQGCRVVLEPEEFYLILSLESVRIPPQFAAEMAAYDPTSGELRTHYAGFFDPGFGYGGDGQLKGTRAVLEVRAHDVPFILEHGQRVCRLEFEGMCESPTRLYGEAMGSSYQGQELTLSKHFRREGSS
ncbi:MAG: 2'-deoxycytidine 5'-triphosphate deaminase [Dehalococcoidia bacterium]|nr:2'-deoxycytidine 5'-triphosphate deaminase [Dehalococcoidia bacterium]